MDSNNLATVFAPNILHCVKPGSNKELSTERVEERIDVINVIRSMIEHNKELFKVSMERVDLINHSKEIFKVNTERIDIV